MPVILPTVNRVHTGIHIIHVQMPVVLPIVDLVHTDTSTHMDIQCRSYYRLLIEFIQTSVLYYEMSVYQPAMS